MKLRSKAGFTLVELIVVIAILAILAGVAIPVYSGYIKKADEAGDTQLVSAANTAIAAACTENNVALADASDYLTTDVTSADKGCTVEFEAVKAAGASEPSALAAEMLKDFTAYHGSASITFKYYVGATINATGNLDTTDPS